MLRDKKQHTPADSAVITEGETKWEGELERERGLLFSHCLSAIIGERAGTQGPLVLNTRMQGS